MVKFTCNLFIKVIFYINNDKYMVFEYLRCTLLAMSVYGWLLMN